MIKAIPTHVIKESHVWLLIFIATAQCYMDFFLLSGLSYLLNLELKMKGMGQKSRKESDHYFLISF